LDVNVGIEISVHFVVEIIIKTGSTILIVCNIFTRVRTCWIEAPRSSRNSLCLFRLKEIRGFPTTCLCLTLLLIDS
jgi:hypothetical protein